MIELTSKQRKILEKAAHSLEPVVIIGQGGVSENLEKHIQNAFNTHELIKVKFNEYKEDKHLYSKDIEEKTDSTLVRIIGNTAIFYKMAENPEDRQFKF